MNKYEQLVKEGRKQVTKVTVGQLKEINKLYEDTIMGLSKTAAFGDKAITKRWAISYMNEVEKARKKLVVEIAKSSVNNIRKTSQVGVDIQKAILKDMFKLGGKTPGKIFDSMFSQVNDNVIKNIIGGGLYKDNKTLSSRIWNYGSELEKDLQYMVNQALLEKKSAKDMANGLKEFVKLPPNRSKEWAEANPRLMNKYASSRALTMARTTINHAYQTATIQASMHNPFVEAIEWSTSNAHNTCEWCEEQENTDQFGLGVGIFPKDEVNLDHPNGACVMLPYIIMSSSQIADAVTKMSARDIDGALR